MRSVPKPKDSLPARLRELWIEQLCVLAQRKKAPENRRQTEAFFKHLVNKNQSTVKSLWDAYNIQRSKAQHLRVTEVQHATSYMMAFHPNNIQRNYQILKRVAKEGPFFEKLRNFPKVHVLDLGCGGGAWSASLLEILSSGEKTPELYVDLMDRSKYFLMAAKHGIERVYQPKVLKTLQADLRDQKLEMIVRKIVSDCKRDERFLFIGLSYVWNEINSSKAKEHLLDLLYSAFQSPQPVAFSFSEPGREHEAREAMDFRQWLAGQGMHMLYPCPTNGNCPMLLSGIDWCYSEVVDHDLEEWQWLADVLKLQRQKLATASYVALNPAAMAVLGLTPQNARQPRIVGFPEVHGFKQTLLCVDGLLKREKGYNPATLRGEPQDLIERKERLIEKAREKALRKSERAQEQDEDEEDES